VGVWLVQRGAAPISAPAGDPASETG